MRLLRAAESERHALDLGRGHHGSDERPHHGGELELACREHLEHTRIRTGRAGVVGVHRYIDLARRVASNLIPEIDQEAMLMALFGLVVELPRHGTSTFDGLREDLPGDKVKSRRTPHPIRPSEKNRGGTLCLPSVASQSSSSMVLPRSPRRKSLRKSGCGAWAWTTRVPMCSPLPTRGSIWSIRAYRSVSITTPTSSTARTMKPSSSPITSATRGSRKPTASPASTPTCRCPKARRRASASFSRTWKRKCARAPAC